MNIVLYTNSFLPAVGGKEIVVHYLAREFQRMGHRVRVLVPGGCRKYRRYLMEYPVHRWPTLRGMMTETVLQLQLQMDLMLFGADIIHVHNTYPCGYTVSRIRKQEYFPIVVTPHGYDIHVIPKMNFGMRLDPVKARKIERTLLKAELLTAISKSIRTSLIDAGAPKVKIIDIPNGIDLERFRPERKNPKVKKILGLPAESRIILSIGNYHPRKGQEFLIRSLPAILKRHPEARLVIVGRNPLPLAQIARKNGLADKILLTGPIPFKVTERKSLSNNSFENDILADLYNVCEVYVSASMEKNAEGLSLAMLDAMGAGKAVIATDISGNRDLINNGQTGLLVPPGDSEAITGAVLAVFNNKSFKEKLEKNSRKIGKKYSWRNIAKQYLAAYRCAVRIKSASGICP